MNIRTHRRSSAGFTLLETMIAIVVLVIGVLGLAAMLADGLAYMSTAQYDYVAQQKAAEATESVFTARDIGQHTWNSICNVGSTVCPSGIFLNGPQILCDPGADGILGTADDFSGSSCTVSADALMLPSNSTGLFNTGTGASSAIRVPLTTYNFKRTIAITAVPNVANLRQIQVTITYTVGRFSRTYTLTTNISNFS
jgi:type II secretory pathway pseudopilin PulG